uniref:Ricin B-type lectin domain-containing protein n=1 Tax=Macrostomum lignano TaxID=282301 RepID=A0A1I8JL91_9PLAT
HASWVFERARGVEIWTSDSSSQLFSGDHCSSRSMSSQFNQSQQHWRLCGVTESNNSQIIAGEIFTVNCVAETRQLLLRRNITSADASSYHDYMSFADLRLQTFQLEASKAELVAENSSFSVSCALRCSGPPDATSRDLQLCSLRTAAALHHRSCGFPERSLSTLETTHADWALWKSALAWLC